MQPRYYQIAALEALYDYWGKESGNPLIDLATGVGKSYLMTMIVRSLLDGWHDMRILIVTDSKELVEQNHQELKNDWPEAPTGIYSAGLGRADYRAQILFGGIQTIWNKTNKIGFVDVILIDECHMISRDNDSSYGKLFAALREINPDIKIVGLTATPYRLDSGRLDQGEDRMFDKVIYTYSIADGVRDGYLTPLSTKETASEISTFGVKKAGKDFQKTALGKAADEITEAAVAEIVAKGADRRSWLAFCSGKEHAYHVRDAIRRHGITCEAICDDTPSAERKRILEAYKNYEIRCLTNNSVLTKGFNHKGVDLIAALRPTLSVSLYLQMCLDDKTEILTRRGWMGPETIKGDDLVAGFDADSGEIKWQGINGVVDRKIDPSERMVGVDAPHIDFRITDGHNLVLATRSSRIKREDKPNWILETAGTAMERRSNIFLPVAGNMKATGLSLTDPEISFLGWFLSDGTLSRKNNAISISQQVTSPQIPHIKRTLDACGFRYGIHIAKRNNQYADNARFFVSYGDVRIPNGTGDKGWNRLAEFINSDKVITDSYDDISREQLLVLLDSLNRGDGHKGLGKATWTQRTYHITFGLNKSAASRIQELCILRGIRANVSFRDPSNATLRACVEKDRAVIGGSAERGVGRSAIVDREAVANERVWCVETDMGTIITRRNGKVTIMGNCGRGTRSIYRAGFNEYDPKLTANDRRQAIADGPKPSCLILDFARLVDEHGPVDSVVVSEPGSGDGEAPSKVCPPETREGAKRDKNGIFGCGEKLHASARSCKFCGYEFEFDTGPKIDSTASDKPIMSTTPPEWRYVLNRRFNLNQKGDAPNIKVAYINGKSQIYEWLGPAHKGLLFNRFKSFWSAHGGEDPLPRDALEFLDRQNELRQTQRILVTPGKGGYWNIKDYDVGAIADERSLFQKLKGDRKERPPLLDEMMDEIPF